MFGVNDSTNIMYKVFCVLCALLEADTHGMRLQLYITCAKLLRLNARLRGNHIPKQVAHEHHRSEPTPMTQLPDSTASNMLSPWFNSAS